MIVDELKADAPFGKKTRLMQCNYLDQQLNIIQMNVDGKKWFDVISPYFLLFSRMNFFEILQEHVDGVCGHGKCTMAELHCDNGWRLAFTLGKIDAQTDRQNFLVVDLI